MSTLRISNIEAKANSSSPSVDEKLKFTNSSGDVLVHVDGKTSGITTIGINTTAESLKFDSNNNIYSTGIITATKFSGIFDGSVTATTATFSGDVSIGGTLTYQDVTNIDSVGVITARSDIRGGRNLNVTGITTLSDDVEFVGQTAGITSVTWDKSSGKLIFKDNAKLVLGTGEDFTMHHDGLGNTILQDDNNLYIKGNSVYIQTNQGEPSAFFNYNGPVKLYYDGGTHTTPKLQTSGIGVTVTGTVDLDALSTTISDTALGLFVYDTSKDSDGGAWRKRTQHCSWYSETFDSKRGSKKEFPAVALLVTTNTRLNIYDADKPDMPLWKSIWFNDNGTSQYGASRPAALDGKIVLGWTGVWPGLGVIDFIKDWAEFRDERVSTGFNRRVYNPLSASGSHDMNSPFTLTTKTPLVGEVVRDVAITVLPNAPIDPDTGLPTPTIAAATAEGVSIIRDTGEVVNVYGTNTSHDDANLVRFGSDGSLYAVWGHDGQGGQNAWVNVFDTVPSTSTGITVNNKTGTEVDVDATYSVQDLESGTPAQKNNLLLTGHSDSNNDIVAGTNRKIDAIDAIPDGFATGQEHGLAIVAENKEDPSHGMVAHITEKYNTGWMHGEVRLVTLASTNTTNIASSTLSPNSASGGPGMTEANNTNGWTNGGMATFESSNTRASLGTYSLHVTANTNGDNCYFSFATVVGKTYVISAKLWVTHDSITLKLGTSQGDGNQYFESPAINANASWQVFTHQLVAETTTTYFNVTESSTSQDSDAYIDEVVVREGELGLNYGMMHRYRGLQAYGTINRTAVATGAELVCYSNFSNSNYFRQEYNNALDFGTGDFYMMFWCNHTQNDAYDVLMERGYHNGSAYSGGGWRLEMGNDQNITLKNSASGASRAVVVADNVYSKWQFICFVRKNKVGYGYRNGVQDATTHAWTEDLDNSNAVLHIGRTIPSGGGDADKTKLSLLRIGKGAPSLEQIKKIYTDESKLFAENAKCTLYNGGSGTDDSVKDISYDTSTDILHVGTPEGRSEFSGLNRINNTTTAVTNSVSASNGLVADE